MLSKRVFAFAIAALASAAALAHPGAPGHVHAELSVVQQVFHAMMNWAPLAVLALIAGVGVLRAAKTN